MASPAEVASRIIQSLAVSEPSLDMSVGTPARKIVDAVAESIAENTLDTHLLTYTYDIDARKGADLDAFVGMFGFTRLAARASSGVVSLQRRRALDTRTTISAGAQFSTGNGRVIFRSIGAHVFPRGAHIIEIPVVAVVGGSTGNVTAGGVTKMVTQIPGVTTVTNPSAMTGGAAAESDAQLRKRFKQTFLRSMAGTEDMFMAVALDDPDTVSAKVYGPLTSWKERIQVVSAAATSSISPLDDPIVVRGATNATPIEITTNGPHSLVEGDVVFISGVVGTTAANGLRRVSKASTATTFSIKTIAGADVAGNADYTSGGSVYKISRLAWSDVTSGVFGKNIDNGDVAAPFLWSFSGGVTLPGVAVSDDATLPDGIYDLRYGYQSQASRNNFVTSVGAQNKVDIYAAGARPKTTSETVVVQGGSLFTANQPDVRSTSRIRRTNGKIPTVGNIFVRLSWAPIVDVPDYIMLGSDRLDLGVDYWVVKDARSSEGGMPDSSEGIEISANSAQAGSVNIVSSTNASPIVVTLPSTHKFQNGQTVRVASHSTNTSANGSWVVRNRTSTTIELEASIGTAVGGATGTVTLAHPLAIKYTTNRVPMAVQRNVESWRLLTTDVAVHQAKQVPLRIHAAVILQPGFSSSSVTTSMQRAISSLFTDIGIGGILQISDLQRAMASVSGVDAVRLLSSLDMNRLSVTAATNASPIQITTASAHGFAVGALVQIDGAAGNTAANGVWTVASVPTTTTLTLTDSSGNGSYTSGGQIFSAGYAIQVMEESGVPRTVRATRGTAPYRPLDIVANDGEIFVLHSLVVSERAQNQWGVL